MTDAERDALVEEIARTICLHRPMPACRCASVGRCQARRDNLLGEYGSYAITAPAVLDAIAPDIRADERARVLTEATTNEAVVRALLAERLYHTDLATCDPPEWPGDWDDDNRDEMMDGMRAALHAALRGKP